MQILHNQQYIPNYLGYFGFKHCYQLTFLASKSSCDRVVQKNVLVKNTTENQNTYINSQVKERDCGMHLKRKIFIPEISCK